MEILSPLLVSKPIALALTAVAIVVFLFATNVTITEAQQQQQQQQLMNSSQQPAGAVSAQNGTLFESQQDSFRLQVPGGWIIHDVNNTASILAAEVTQGYGLLAELCTEDGAGLEEQQQGEAVRNMGSSSSDCQQQQARGEEIIHILRYPNMSARIPIAFEDINNSIPDSVLEYEIQSLQEVGYRNINILNSTDTRTTIHYINDATAEELGAKVTIPSRLVEITYSTVTAPGETKRGDLLLTATNITPPNLETITGYSIFYESGSAQAEEEQTTTTASITSSPPPAVIRQVFDSFELIPSEEADSQILANVGEQIMSNLPEEDEDGDEDGDEDE